VGGVDAAGDSAQVTVRWWSGVEPCHALAEVRLEETADTITLTVLEASVHPDGEPVACTEQALAKQHTVTLAAPVGARSIVDGAAGS
jgi:hypothetical protein